MDLDKNFEKELIECQKKMEPIVLSRIMGHSGTNMLNSVYIHVTDKRKEKALQEAYKDIN